MSNRPTVWPGAVNEWFELSYASYLVWPRVLMEHMPDEWQERFVALADEIEETFQSYPRDGESYAVQMRKRNGRYCRDPLAEYRHPDRRFVEALKSKKGRGS